MTRLTFGRLLAAAMALASAPVTLLIAQSPTPPPEVLWACYVPLTGTVYRISPTGAGGLKTDCTSTSHVKFSWNNVGPQGPKGDPGSAGGMSGYEIVTATVQNPFLTLRRLDDLLPECVSPIGGSSATCSQYALQINWTADAPGVAQTVSCPSGKRPISVFVRLSVDHLESLSGRFFERFSGGKVWTDISAADPSAVVVGLRPERWYMSNFVSNRIVSPGDGAPPPSAFGAPTPPTPTPTVANASVLCATMP